MAGEILSTNMSLPIPGVGVTAGPQWATDVNNCLTIIDGHNHTPGYGVSIPPSGLNINADLPFNNNNLISLRSARFTSQAAVLSLSSDLDCLYVVGADLYYNDGVGNNVRITQSGAVAGSPGSISNLVSPASAAYVSGNATFVWQSAVNTPANLDAASIILRNLTANSKGLTLNPPAAMAADISVTLPSLPAITSLVTIDTSGNMGTTNPNQLVPTGTTIINSGGTTPSGFLACGGAAVSRSTYANLFTALGTTYGPGDGSTTFNLPNAAGPYFLGVNSIPSYVQSYWKMNQSSGGEPNFGTNGSTYALIQTGSVGTAAGHVSPINSRGAFAHTSYLSVPLLNSSTTPYDAQQFAFGFWMKTNTTGVLFNIMSKFDNSTNGYEVYGDTSGLLNINIAGTNHTASTPNLADNQWHLVFFCNLSTGGASNFRMYVDNALVYQTAGLTYTPAAADLILGSNIVSGSPSSCVQYLTLVEFWNSVPSTWAQFETLINQRWNGGAGVDYVAEIQQTYIIKT